ncbi:copper resistance CopC family protein [Bacillus marasmi]|uniref:copper resistance CopC family protein n=1 Tax=Bacillus marasmi TaxID=1926279 RepID=UPI0011CC1A29|nr:copper resistance CopC family protein [Bacillus marasmi]
MKKLLLFTIIFFLAFVNGALAHTGLKSSSPQYGEIINDELNQIRLIFETKIEQGSKLEINHSNGEPVQVDNIAITENQMVGNLSNFLNNGNYIVNWEIIGADGHPLDGEFTFSVDLPVSEEQEPRQDQLTQKDETQPQADEVKEDKTKADDAQQSNKAAYPIPVILGVLIVIIVASFLFLMKRKQ